MVGAVDDTFFAVADGIFSEKRESLPLLTMLKVRCENNERRALRVYAMSHKSHLVMVLLRAVVLAKSVLSSCAENGRRSFLRCMCPFWVPFEWTPFDGAPFEWISFVLTLFELASFKLAPLDSTPLVHLWISVCVASTCRESRYPGRMDSTDSTTGTY